MAPNTPLRSVKYLSITPKITPHSGHINKMKPDLAVKQIMVSPLSLMAASRSPTSWIMMILFSRKIRGKMAENIKSESVKADPEDVGNTYGIDHFKIGEAKHGSNESK